MLVAPATLFLVIITVDNVMLKCEGPCQCGYFQCGNTSICIEKKLRCDDKSDCPNGEDECNEMCLDKSASTFQTSIRFKLNITRACECGDDICIKESMMLFLNKTSSPSKRRNINKYSCVLESYPKNCSCNSGTRVICKVPQYTFPASISRSVTVLILQNTYIQNLEANISQYSKLKKLDLEDNFIKEIPPFVFHGMTELMWLWLANNEISFIKNNSFSGLPKLRKLYLEFNNISYIEKGALLELVHLETLDLSYNVLTLEEPYPLHVPFTNGPLELWIENNHITQLSSYSIQNAQNVAQLRLFHNQIANFDVHPMKNLKLLNLSHNALKWFEKELFPRNNQIVSLSIQHNPIEYLPVDAFFHLRHLVSLELGGINIPSISPVMFENTRSLKFIYFKKFEYCRYTPDVLCEPIGDGISSIDNLLDLAVFRICIWVVAFFTCSGNIFVMVLRLILRDERNIHSLFIKNLCAADFMMGVYLAIVASHDVMFRNRYNDYAYKWMSSWCCQATGFLAMTSCEVSLLLVTFMSMERSIRIAFPYKVYNFNSKRAVISLICIWTIGLAIGLIPMFSRTAFGTFYGSNGVCFPLHIHDPFLPGWEYSAFVFVGVNLVSMVLITLCYMAMFINIRNSQKKTNNPLTKDISFAKRFFLIVITDAVCWIPIIVIKILVFTSIRISDQFYAWLTIFVLPINSAINPIVYSLTTTTFRKKFRETFFKNENTGPSATTVLTINKHITDCHRKFLPRRSVVNSVNPGNNNTEQQSILSTVHSNEYDNHIDSVPAQTRIQLLTSNGTGNITYL